MITGKKQKGENRGYKKGMKVREVLKFTAELLGLGDGNGGEFDCASPLGEKLLEKFLTVENEVALDYLPLVAEDEIVSETGVIFFSELTKTATRILKISGENGESAPFAIYPQYVKTQPSKLVVRYAYAPSEKGLDDEVEAQSCVSPRLLAYGVASAYCLGEGLYSEATVWEGKYKKALLAAYKVTPSRVVSSRRWV